MNDFELRDPTAETAAVMRDPIPPPGSLDGLTIGLFSIAKERSDEFHGYLERKLRDRGHNVRRFAKATHTKIAAESVVADMVEHADIVIAGLAD